MYFIKLPSIFFSIILNRIKKVSNGFNYLLISIGNILNTFDSSCFKTKQIFNHKQKEMIVNKIKIFKRINLKKNNNNVMLVINKLI